MKAKNKHRTNRGASNDLLGIYLTKDLRGERLFVQLYTYPPAMLRMFRGPDVSHGWHIVDLPANSISDATNLLVRMGYRKPRFLKHEWGAEATLKVSKDNRFR